MFLASNSRPRSVPPIVIAYVFTKSRSELEEYLALLRSVRAPAGILWVSWPKKSSKVATNITENTIREVALPLGLVDVKVCAVDATWSGLKLVIRRSLRQTPSDPQRLPARVAIF